MPIRDLLHKKNKIADAQVYDDDAPPIPTFVRSDTNTYEVITPPSFGNSPIEVSDGANEVRSRLSIFKPRSRSNSAASHTSTASSTTPSGERSSLERPPNPKRFSERLHRRRERASSHVPDDLPDIAAMALGDVNSKEEGKEDAERKADVQAQWEERATKLAQFNELNSAGSSSPSRLPPAERHPLKVSSPGGDDNIQEAIRLHEAGELVKSTSMFGRLAENENNALSQVLYGLALRHGWGIEPDAAKAVTYLSAAASNAAQVENLALEAGMKKGGAAKGELVLAIFELANCFRHGWGVPKDAAAAKHYYETSANLGDTDAMNEVAWCYLEGFGAKKDKFTAARYYRLAETNGNKTMGNSWIWKPKYDPK